MFAVYAFFTKCLLLLMQIDSELNFAMGEVHGFAEFYANSEGDFA